MSLDNVFHIDMRKQIDRVRVTWLTKVAFVGENRSKLAWAFLEHVRSARFFFLSKGYLAAQPSISETGGESSRDLRTISTRRTRTRF
eukprot:774616-Amorphochlora_amoeboformis.AAC.3